MAVTVKEHRIIDSNKRALIKYTINSDGTAVANSGLIDVSTLAYALNTNGYIMSGNTDPRSSYRVAVKRVSGSIANTTSGLVTLKWNDSAFTEILGLGPGNFDIGFDSQGDGSVIPNPFTRANANGDIVFSSSLPAGAFATLFVDLRKEGSDYDQGQTNDPAAFNKGRWGIP